KKLKMILVAPAIVAFFTMFQIETQAQIKEPLDIEKVNEEAQNLDSNKKNHTNNDLNSMPLNEDDLRYTTINIDDNGTNIQFPKNSKHLEDGTIVSEDGRILANIETKENSNNNLTFVI